MFKEYIFTKNNHTICPKKSNHVSFYNKSKKEFTDRVNIEELYKRYHLTPKLIVEDIKKIK